MNKQLFINDLQLNIQGDVLVDEFSLGMYSTDASLYQIMPLAIVLPKHEEDVKSALQIAADHKISVLPRGGGTSLAGQTVGQSMILDFSKYMNQILDFSEEERWVRVQPGIVRDVLNTFLATYGLVFAPDPATSSRANIGGMVGNNSSGTKSILYGKTVDHVLEIKALLADGTTLHTRMLSSEARKQITQKETREGQIYKEFEQLIQEHKEEIEARFPKVMRRVGGYNLDEFIHENDWNLSKLLCGSEGTLAVMLELKLNLVPLPNYKSVCVAHFESIGDAVRAVSPILEFQPSAVEILDKTVIELSRENLETQRHCHFIEGNPAAVLLVEFYGDTEKSVLERPELMAKSLDALQLGYAFPFFPEGDTYRDAWLIRKKGLGLMLGLKGRKKPIAFIEDAAIPLEHLPEYLDRVLAICEKYDTKAAAYAHASVGVLHVRPILDMQSATDIERMKKIATETLDLVMEYGGSWSGEHGDGLVRSSFNEQFFGTKIYHLLKQVKQLFDPEGRMNPGKIVDAQQMDENLRYGTEYQDNEVNTFFRYRKELSFNNAVHMCNGVGECRKTQGGTMCPSFRATMDEEHSTRGRANALRLAMSGQLGKDGLAEGRLQQVMDLCLSCKACKSECPSNVDMAKLKAEVAQQHFDKHGVPWRTKMIGKSAEMAKRFAGVLAPAVNAIQGTSLFRKLLATTSGIDARRRLPNYAKNPFFKWFATHNIAKGKAQVVLFADTYLNYYEPQVGISAVNLLEACGYEVLLANVGCCQRPLLSNGLLRAAKEEGQKVAEKLDVYLGKGLKIVVCEPSCASALNDDLPDLLEDEALAKRLKKGVMMIDKFLQEEQKSGKLQVKFQLKSSNNLLHGHCHQKALYGTTSMLDTLTNSKENIHEVNAGCCGMAGSFGYEKEHYDLSKKIGESRLFPALEADKSATVVACGFSCRHQIEHFTGRKAIHWVEAVEVCR